MPLLLSTCAIDAIDYISKAHEGSDSRDPARLKSSIAPWRCPPPAPGRNRVVVVLDDVLTTSAHFAARRDSIHAGERLRMNSPTPVTRSPSTISLPTTRGPSPA